MSELHRDALSPSQRRPAALFIVLLLGLLLLNTLPVLSYVPNRDESAYGYISFVLAKGGRLYTDVWTHKPPLLFLIGAAMAGFLGPNLSTLHWTALTMDSISVILFFLVAMRWWGVPSAAVSSALLAWGLSSSVLEGGFMTENLAVMWQLASFAASLVWIQSGRSRWLVLAGLAGGLAHLARQLSMTLLVGQIGFMLRFPYPRAATPSRDIRSLGLLCLGWGIPVVVSVLGAAIQGSLADFLGLVYTYRLVNPDVVPPEPFLRSMSASGGLLLLPIGLLLAAVVDIIRRRALRAMDVYLWAWLGAEIGAVLLLGGNFPHHLIPVLAPTLLIGGAAILALFSSFEQRRRVWPVRALIIGGLLLSAWPWIDRQVTHLRGVNWVDSGLGYQVRYDDVFQADAAAFLRGRGAASAFVFGFDPAVYLLADVRSTSRFFHSLPLAAENVVPAVLDRHRDLFLEEFSICPPEYVLVKTPPALQPYEGKVGDFPEFQTLLAANYSEEDAGISGYRAFRRLLDLQDGQCGTPGRPSFQ